MKQRLGSSEQSKDRLFTEASTSLLRLETQLVTDLDGIEVSADSKLPFKVLWFRESLFWRMAQLGRSALGCLETNKLVSGILLVRGTMETAAAIWFLKGLIKRCTENGAIGDTNLRIEQLLLGTRLEGYEPLPKAQNVLNFVDSVDKEIPGIRGQYDQLSEFAHPNWSGTALMFSKADKISRVSFGEHLRGEDGALFIGLANLASALDILQVAHHSLIELMPKFVELCEAEVQGS